MVKKMGLYVLLFVVPTLCSFLLVPMLCVGTLALFNQGIALAGEPPAEPILRIETGMHTAMINRIGIDAENRYLVTGSGDKTIRVWELSSGRLIRTLRPPIDIGNEGKVYAVAISPDGKTIACGGWTGWDWERSAYIYFFERETGRLIKRISGLPNRVIHLTYSKDGRHLVAALRENNGIRIYETSNYNRIAEDRDYGDASYGADFSKDGRLATSSLDGFVRLYDRNFSLIAKKKSMGGNQPFHVSFSPDGAKIAVGFSDSTKVDVLDSGLSTSDSRLLTLLYSPDTKGVDKGNLGSVSFSSDGRYLYAGGEWVDGTGKRPIRKWSDEGKGSFTDLPAADSTIMHILPLSPLKNGAKGVVDGGIIFGSADPAFGIIDNRDEKVIYKGSSIADYRDLSKNFLISYNGSIVQFGYEPWGKSPARFSIEEKILDTDSPLTNLSPNVSIGEGDRGLSSPITSGSKLNITDWKYTYTPKLNGQALKLMQYEISRSLAVSPNGNSFLLGTEWYLRLFDRDGNEIWNAPVPGVAWAVNISGNGKVAVAAFGDGTIRWYKMSDGKEILTFFPLHSHAERGNEKWVLWTPSGYYDASPGADELIGWHINNGKDNAADFFPASRFRDRYYRPDVAAKVLTTLDESEAVRLANEESGRKSVDTSIQQMLPPVVTILSPSNNTEVNSAEITVRYSLRTPSGEAVTGIKALIDGRPVVQERGVQIKEKVAAGFSLREDIREIKVTIPERDSEISIIAENKYSSSEPSSVRLKWMGAKKGDEFVIKPKLYILSVGVSKYEDKGLTLGFASKDARDFAGAMFKQKDVLYRDVTAKILTDEKATKDEILDGLDWIQKETTSKDVAMVFFAGHGVNDQTGIYYFLPANADTEKLKRTGVVFSDIKNTLSSLSGKTLFFVDTCHSGNVMGARRGAADITAVINELSSAESGAVVFASSTGKQYSFEDKAWGNGAFTKALVEGISGKADYTGKGRITINMLDLYMSERVKELTKGKQTPTTTKPQTIPDFPIAVRR